MALLALCIGTAMLAGIAVYHIVAGYYHYRYYVRRRAEPETWKCQPERFLSPKMQRTAVLTGTGNLALTGAITGILVYGMVTGALETPLYTDVRQYGWPYTIGMTAVLFVMTDWANYLVHRLFHVRLLCRRFHLFHHRFGAPTPYVATALHPVEMLAQQAVSFLPLLLIPFHAAAAAGVLLYNLIFNIIDHSGVRHTSVLPWQPSSRFHDDHHALFHVNFGQHLTIWDRMFGTLRRQNRRHGQNASGGRGAPEGGASDGNAPDGNEGNITLEPCVRY